MFLGYAQGPRAIAPQGKGRIKRSQLSMPFPGCSDDGPRHLCGKSLSSCFSLASVISVFSVVRFFVRGTSRDS